MSTNVVIRKACDRNRNFGGFENGIMFIQKPCLPHYLLCESHLGYGDLLPFATGSDLSVADSHSYALVHIHIHTDHYLLCSNTKRHQQIGKKMRLRGINSQQEWEVACILKESVASHPCRVENTFIRQAGQNK